MTQATHDLNEPQRHAVEHDTGPILVLAGAGSGKTRVITHRIARLIARGVSPYELLALTFTNKAAAEMRQRAETLVGTSTRGLWIGTFHAICSRLLRAHGEAIGLSPRFIIYDTADQKTLLKRVLRDLGVSERLFSPRDVLGHIDRAKNKGIGPDDYHPEDFYGDVVAKVYPRYEKALLAADAADFGNLLLKTLELLRGQPELATELASRFRHVLVDEFQDTNHVQYQIVRILSSGHHNLCVVGDDDQSIYGWRGADIRNILDFERDHPNAIVVKLEQNYRSTQTILDAAGAVIRRNLDRKAKTLWTAAGPGEPIHVVTCADERDEAAYLTATIKRLCAREGFDLDDIAIFYRTHAQSRAVEETLRAAKLPHAVFGGVRFFDRAEIKDALAYLRVLANAADEVSLRRIINVPPRGIGASTLAKITDHAQKTQSTFHEALRACAANTGAAHGVLGTGPRKKINAFCELLDELKGAAESLGPADLAERVLERSSYLERLAANDSVESESRTENLMELISSLHDYEERTETPALHDFLEQVALASETDNVDPQGGIITLMTVHSAKGLEFPVVFLIGLEQGIFPHGRSLDDLDRMEEERRLAYVAITRARKRLYLTHAVTRYVFGQRQNNRPSVFLNDIPEGLVVRPRPGRGARTSAYGARTRSTSPGRPVTSHDDIPFDDDPFVDLVDDPFIDTATVKDNAPAARTFTLRPDAPDPSPSSSKNRGPASGQDIWTDYDFDQTEDVPESFRVGQAVSHGKYGAGVVQAITGHPPTQNLVIRFRSGPRTIRAQFVRPA
ncbi:MAG: exodeoxyribonuclease V subunit gamma [Deltaproteobacteria bacterium]|nr:exodeoxyribonuclease V subunit gamma [Deltaproteobacteria bacterium]